MKIFQNIAIYVATLVLGACQSYNIESIQSYDEVNFSEIRDESLVIFDVDETLQQCSDNYGINEFKSPAREFRLNLVKQNPGIKDWEYISSLFLLQANRPLIEPHVIDKINILKEKKIPFIACTAMNTGKLGKIERMEQWRYEQLKSLGFVGIYENLIVDLPTGGHPQSLGFEKLYKQVSDYSLRKSNPIFYKGIIATDVEAKGPVVGKFLDIFRMRPETIVMFDDKMHALISVQDECKKRNINFQGYHYNGYKVEPWNEKLAKIQANYLIKHHKWLSDAEAKKQMVASL